MNQKRPLCVLKMMRQDENENNLEKDVSGKFVWISLLLCDTPSMSITVKINMCTTFEYVQYAMWSLSTPEIAPASDNYYVLCDDWTLHTPL